MIKILPTIHCPRCPTCGTEVDAFAVVDSEVPGFPPRRHFWGLGGDRALMHKVDGAWCHFRVGAEHRLAYLGRKATIA